jgi:hypothetical protein
MRIACFIFFAAFASLSFAAIAQSGGGASINKVQERQIFDETTRNYSKPDRPASPAFGDECTAVLGLADYCGCLGDGMPTGVAFDNFVVVLTHTKQENGYDKLDAASKRAYDAIPKLRDKCATQVADRSADKAEGTSG